MGGDRTLVVVPAYGLAAMTRATVGRLLVEACDVLVVDNAGDYTAVGRERVRRPGANLGWLGAANLGLEWGFARGYANVVLLNNDVRTSRDFVRGLVRPTLEPGRAVGIVGPLADDVDMGNGQYFPFDPDAFVPCPEVAPTTFIHGSCLLLTAAGFRAVGLMDPAQQPYGWGTDVEAGYLARRAGLEVLISKHAHMRHANMTTVRAGGADVAAYSERARSHVRAVFRAKYGPRWQALLGFDFGTSP